MCNFDITEFQSLWVLFGESVRIFHSVGPGRMCPYSGKDVFYMCLLMLKFLTDWDIVVQLFNVRTTKFKKMLSLLTEFGKQRICPYKVQ